MLPHRIGVILAAGKGVRMRSQMPKVLHRAAGKPMLAYVMRAAHKAGIEDLVVVVGHGRDRVMQEFADEKIRFVVQEEQLGTGHALLVAEKEARAADLILVLCGDTPLIRPSTLQNLIEYHEREQAAATVLTAVIENPTGYGRIIRGSDGGFLRIVEEKDASPEEKTVHEVNTGMYCFDASVFEILKKIKPENAQGEYYLTDALTLYREAGKKVLALAAADSEDIYGINDRVQLAEAEKALRRRKVRELMLSGVTIMDPDSTFVDMDVVIGPDTVIYPFTIIEGVSVIGEECRIGPGTHLTDVQVGDGTVIEYSRAVQCVIGRDCTVGPFAYLRPETVLADGVKVGDFVEIKKSRIGRGSKVPHLSYVGDAEVGEDVNIGAGTITCNYDGERKHVTVIEDGAFIGSNTNLVAPVRIGARAVTGAGSTITRDVPAGALAVERAEQKHVEGWRRRKASRGKE